MQKLFDAAGPSSGWPAGFATRQPAALGSSDLDVAKLFAAGTVQAAYIGPHDPLWFKLVFVTSIAAIVGLCVYAAVMG